MSVALCTRCLARLQLCSPSPALLASAIPRSTASFHTSPINLAMPAKSKPGRGKEAKIPYRITATPSYTGKRKKKRVLGKLPAPGERRAARMRIVLSNTNANEIVNLDDLSPENMADEAKIGQMLGLDGTRLDQLRATKAFKRVQSWALFSRPATLLRSDSVEMGQLFEKMNSGQKTILRQVICGETMCGKSILLLQAMAMAYMSGWVVINVPEAVEHVNNHHSYAPLSNQDTNGPNRRYTQPSLTADLLGRLAHSNEAVLKSLRLNNKPPKELFASPPANLAQAALYGSEHPAQAWPIFEYVIKELTDEGRPPILFAIDSLNHWMGPSAYRNSDHEIIHAHQFTLVQFFLKALFGNMPMPNGGMVLGATTGSNFPTSLAFDFLLKQIAALNNGIDPTSHAFPLPAPYQKLDSPTLSLLDTAATAKTTINELKGLSKPETWGLLEYFQKSGILKDAINDVTVGEKWSMSGSGNVGELCKVSTRARIDPNKVLSRFGSNVGVKMGQGEHIPKTIRS